MALSAGWFKHHNHVFLLAPLVPLKTTWEISLKFVVDYKIKDLAIDVIT